MNITSLKNYELIQQKTLQDLQSEGYLLRHKKSGARVLLMENKDEILAVGKRAKEIILPWASTADEYEKIYEKLISNNVGKEKL